LYVLLFGITSGTSEPKREPEPMLMIGRRSG